MVDGGRAMALGPHDHPGRGPVSDDADPPPGPSAAPSDRPLGRTVRRTWSSAYFSILRYSVLLAMRRARAIWVRLPWYVKIAVTMASRSTASRPVTGREPGTPEVGSPPALAAATSASRSATVTVSPAVMSTRPSTTLRNSRTFPGQA